MRGARLLHLTFLLTFLLVLPVLAQAPTDQALTNADIVRMMKAGMPESIILREIRMSNTDFAISPAALIELKKQGASERILGAVLDSRMGISQVGARTASDATHCRASGGAGPAPFALR